MKINLCLFLFILLFSSSCSFNKKKKYLTPLKELTLKSDSSVPSVLTVENYEDDFFTKDPNYILDLYFLISNDALELGCLEIAHNGFVFLYENDEREGNREVVIRKFSKIKDILRLRAIFAKQEFSLFEYKKLGLRDDCEELKKSLE